MPGMYLGSAAAMLVLPSVSAAFGPASLLRLVGLLGLTWLLLWLAVGQEIPHRCVMGTARGGGGQGLIAGWLAWGCAWAGWLDGELGLWM